MTIAFRVLFLTLLGGFVLLWYLDFQPRRLTALFDPLVETSRLAPDTADEAGRARIEQRLASLEVAISGLAASLPPPVDTGALERRIAAIGDRLEVIQRTVSEESDQTRPPGSSDLERRISALAGQVAALADRSGPGTDLSGVRARLASVEQRLAGIADRPALSLDPERLRGQIAALESRVEALAAEPELERRLGDLAGRLDRIQAGLTALAQRPPPALDTAEFHAALSDIEARLDRIDNRPPPASVPQDLGARLSAVEARLHALAANQPQPVDLAPLEHRLDALDAAVAGVTARPTGELPDRIDTRLGDLEKALDALSSGLPEPVDLSMLERRLDALDAAVARTAARPQPELDTTALKPDLAALETRLKTIDADLAALATRPAPRLETGALESRISEITGRLDGIEARLSALDTAPLEGRLADLGAKLDALSAEIPPAVDSAAFEARLTKLESRLSGMAATLGARPALQSPSKPAPAPAGPGAQTGTAIHTTDEAWMRIRDGERIVFEGLVPAGGSVPVPANLAAPELRSGNAGSVYIVVNGVAYGPLGRPRQVVRDVPLDPGAVRARFPRAAAEIVSGGGN